MSATYIHTKRKLGFTLICLRSLAFIYFVTLGLSIIYLWLFTQNRFISTADFKVSSQSAAASNSGLTALALPGLGDVGYIDAQIVIGFLNSSDLLLELEKQFHLADHYKASSKDFVFRLKQNANLEERLEYYRKRITAHFDLETGLTVMTVDTFDPELSRGVANALLHRAEIFINTVNKNIADQQIEFAKSEVDRGTKRVDELNTELLEFQNANNFINPEEVVRATVGAIEKFRIDKLQTQTELATIEASAPGSPRIDGIRNRLKSLNELISLESAKLSGPEKTRLNQILVQFKLLEQKIAFAIQVRDASELLLERNRVAAISKSRFLTVIQRPYLPEDVGLPRRPYATVTLIALGLLMFMIFRAITRAIFSMI